jgi:hypothetical protein
MSEYDPLRPEQEINDHRSSWDRLVIGCILIAMVVLTLMMLTATSGCVSMAKEYAFPTPTPTPEPVPTIATPEPTPTPIPTEDPRVYMLRTNGRMMNQWHHWVRENVSGYQDMSTWVTVYGYKMLPFYHFHDSLWGSKTFRKQSPAAGMQYLFVFVNIYADGDDVRQWLFPARDYVVYINGTPYYPEDITRPEEWIQELSETWDYAHVDTVQPYGYKIVQEGGTGILYVEAEETLYGGRSNAEDGYILFQVPRGVSASDIRVYGNFANLGGFAWWQLK